MLDHSTPYRFAYGRTALKYGLMALGFTIGDGVLVPDFICESAVEPFHQLGLTVQYYPVTASLEPDWDTIKNNHLGEIRAMMIVHYFGHPQHIARCLEFCERHNLILIEDNAHGFGALLDGRLAGTFGAMGVSSPRKSFPIETGACLYIGDSIRWDPPRLVPQSDAGNRRGPRLTTTIARLPLIESARSIRRWAAQRRHQQGPPPPYDSQDAFREAPLENDFGMDTDSARFLEQQDLQSVRRRRHQIHQIWLEWAECKRLTPIQPVLHPGAMPLVFVARTDSHEASREWFRRGHQAGVDVHSWPTLPRSIVAQNCNAMRLWRSLVCFPIHQDMDPAMLSERLTKL